MDGTGWMPTRTLLDVVWGLNSLFTVRGGRGMYNGVLLLLVYRILLTLMTLSILMLLSSSD